MKILEKLLLFQLIFGATVVVVRGLQPTHQLTVNQKTDYRLPPYRCLGLATAIRPGWILTSATFFEYNRADVDDFIIVGGVTKVGYGKWEDIIARNLFRRVRDYHIPNEFDDHNKENDVALVELDREFDQVVQPIDIFRSDKKSFDKRLGNAYTWKDGTLTEYTVEWKYDARGLYFQDVGSDDKRVEHSPGISIVYDGKLLGLNPGTVMWDMAGYATMIRDRMQFIDHYMSKRILSTTEYVWRTSHQALICHSIRCRLVLSMGSLISSDVILTPADVWDDLDVKDFEALVGVRRRLLPGLQRSRLTERHIPDEYFKRTEGTDDHLRYNFALVMVKEPFETTACVRPIPILWDPRFDPSDKETIMYSWATANFHVLSPQDTPPHVGKQLIKRNVKIVKSSDVPCIELSEKTLTEELTGSSFAYDGRMIGFVWTNKEKQEHGFVEMRRHLDFLKKHVPELVKHLQRDEIDAIRSIKIEPIRVDVLKDEKN